MMCVVKLRRMASVNCLMDSIGEGEGVPVMWTVDMMGVVGYCEQGLRGGMLMQLWQEGVKFEPIK